MEPLIVGALTAITAVLAVGYWQLLVHPETFLALWSRSDEEGWGVHAGAVRALRQAVGALVGIAGFVTGLTLAVLLAT